MFEFDAASQNIFNTYMKFREKLLPYLNKYNAIAAEKGTPTVRHLFLNFQNDTGVYNVEDEFMVGDSLLVAPVLTQGATSRNVYLPSGCSWFNQLDGKTYTGGQTISATVLNGQVAVFRRTDCSAEDEALLQAAFESAEWKQIQNNFGT